MRVINQAVFVTVCAIWSTYLQVRLTVSSLLKDELKIIVEAACIIVGMCARLRVHVAIWIQINHRGRRLVDTVLYRAFCFDPTYCMDLPYFY